MRRRLRGVVLTLVLIGALCAVFLGFAAGPRWALVFLVPFGVALAVQVRRRPRDADVAPADGVSRLIVVADPGCRSEAVADEVQRVAAGRPTEVYLVAPAPDERRDADRRLDETLAFLAAAGVKARAAIADDDPLRATDDVLSRFSAAEIVYVTRPGSTWLDGEVVALAERRYEQRVRSVVVEP